MTLLRIGHRGAAALAPPNTLASIAAAVDAGMDMVELDVIRAHGQIVVSHSARELDERNPPLEVALRALPPGMPLLLDVKRRGFEDELVAELRRHDAIARTIAATGDTKILAELRRLEPALRRSLTFPRNKGRAAALRPVAPWLVPRLIRAVEASFATLQHRVVSRALVDLCHAQRVAVYVWTVNDARLVARLAALGVDGVITDDPGVFPASEATLQA